MTMTSFALSPSSRCSTKKILKKTDDFKIKDPFFDYYYNRRFLVTVITCTVVDNYGRIARGVSVCSPKEEPSFHKGQDQAYHYTLRALKGRGSKPIDCPEAIKVISKTDCPFVYHSELNPRLTFKERHQLFGTYKNEKRKSSTKLQNDFLKNAMTNISNQITNPSFNFPKR